jgi:agmatinase
MRRETNFGDLPKENSRLATAKIVVVPVPFDGTSTWVKGADKGPAAIIEASANMELYDIESGSEPFKHGIYTAEPISEKKSPEKLAAMVEASVSNILERKKFPVLLGGEHSISIGAIQACAKKYENLSVLQLDAHADTREIYDGSKYNHACVMARARELCSIVQVGTRSMDSCEVKKQDKSRIFFAENIQGRSDWHNKAISKLCRKVYLTIDLDVFDPGILPSTGTPEPGGLGWYEVLDFLKKVIGTRELVGLDVVELCPNKQEKSSDFLAAKLIYKLLSYKFGAIK